MKHILFIISLTFYNSPIFGQEIRFLTEIESGSLRCGIECTDSTYLAIGIKNSFAGYDTTYCLADCDPEEDTIITEKWPADFYIVKLNTKGDTVWSKKFGGLGADWIEDIKSINKDFILTGYSSTNSKGNYDFYVSRVNSEGDSVWSILLGDNQCDWGFSSVITSSQNIFALGSTYSFGNGRIESDDIFLVKISSEGDTLFTKTYGDSLNAETGLDIIETQDNNIVLLSTSYYEQNRAIVVSKINETGSIIWSKIYNGDYAPTKLIEDNEANLIITGTRYLFGSDYDEDLLIFKLDQNGDSLWCKTYGNLRENGYFINLTNDENYIVCGSSGGENGGQSDLGLFKISKNNNLIWQRTFDLSEYGIDWGAYVKQTYDNGFVIIGTKGFGGSFVLKTDENGVLTSINENSVTSESITIYPNPFSSNISISNKYKDQILFKLYRLDGSMIIINKIEPGENIYDLSYLNHGIYFYNITDKRNNKIKSGHILKTFANAGYNQ